MTRYATLRFSVASASVYALALLSPLYRNNPYAMNGMGAAVALLVVGGLATLLFPLIIAIDALLAGGRLVVRGLPLFALGAFAVTSVVGFAVLHGYYYLADGTAVYVAAGHVTASGLAETLLDGLKAAALSIPAWLTGYFMSHLRPRPAARARGE